MKVGIQISSFTWPGGPEAIGPTLARIVRDADDVGFDSIWVMDHFFQIRGVGRVEEPMLEGMTTLGFMASHSKRARLGLMVGGVHYRNPGLWVKATTTLDVLSGGRAWLGIGAAWNEEESRALGFPFPPLGVRFEMLEETLRIAHEMFADERGTEASFQGRQYRAERLLNSPQSISRPRVPIMVGGGGERKTLRLVAQYADACNVFGSPEGIARKYAILDAHCAAVGRDPAEIERSTLQNVRLGPPGAARTESPQQVVDRFGELSDASADHVIFELKDVHVPEYLETVGKEIIPALHALHDIICHDVYTPVMPDLTVAQAAEAAGVSERTMRRWIRDGRLAGCYKVGGRVRIPERAIRDAAEPYGESRPSVSAETPRQARRIHRFAAQSSPSNVSIASWQAAARRQVPTIRRRRTSARVATSRTPSGIASSGSSQMILDASVAAKWFLPSEGLDGPSSRCPAGDARPLGGPRSAHRPLVRTRECGGPCDATGPDRLRTRDQHRLRAFRGAAIDRTDRRRWSRHHSHRADGRAQRIRCAVPSLAARRGSSVLTADRRMFERCQEHGYEVVWLGDVTLRDGVLVDTPQGYQG